MATQPSDERLRKLSEAELERFKERTPRSLELARRAVEVLPNAVASGVSVLNPYPLAVREGAGAHVWDIDGNTYSDYSLGFGALPFGHAHPRIAAVIRERAATGTHFGAVTEDAVRWAELIRRRFALDWVRFTSSGTEATMDALRLARARTGRELIAKIEGGYHGTHPDALISGSSGLGAGAGPDQAPTPRPVGRGVADAVRQGIAPLPFNDLEAAERVLSTEAIACVLLEPIMFNVGAIFPEPGYLEGLRELCDRTGTLLVFDEVKTGITVAFGGARELFGVEPDLICLGKGIGGGIGAGAIGGRDPWGYELIESWAVPQLSTFAANPLAAGAGAAALELLDRDAYRRLEEHRAQLNAGLTDAIERWELPAYVIGAAAKNCVVWVEGPELRDYRDYERRFSARLGWLAWLWLVNRGVLLSPGRDEQTTHSIAHTGEDAARFGEAFAELGAALRA